MFDNKNKNFKVFVKCAIAFIAVLLIEVFAFNIGSFFTPDGPEFGVNLSAMFKGLNSDKLKLGPDGYLHVNPAVQQVPLAIGGMNAPVQNVLLKVSGSPQVATIRALYRDSKERFHYSVAYNKLFSVGPEPREVFLKVQSSGNMQDIVLEISKSAPGDFTIESIRFNVVQPFDFSLLRFFVLLIPVLFIIVSVSYRWYDIVTDFTDKKYKIGVIAVLCAALLFSVFILLASSDGARMPDTPYPFTTVKDTSDPYMFVFDAFRHGSSSLGITPDPKLAALGNQVYSQGARENAGAFALHDYVFYEGKYYVYFGVAPVLFVYYPYYFFTGSVPAANKVTFVFAVLCAVFFLGAFIELLKTFCRKANLMLLLAVYLAILFGSLVFMLQLFAYRYEIAHLGGYLFLAASIMFAFKAFNVTQNSGEKKSALVYLFLAGAAFISIGLARPNVFIVAFAFLLPVALKILSDKNRTRSYKISAAASFLIPVAAGLSFIFWYNFARFGSIFEFGEAYQLTGYAIRAFNIDVLLKFPHAVWYYFFDMPNFLPVFPWIQATIHTFNTFGYGVYGDVNAGIMLIPLVWGIFIWWKKNEHSKNDALMKNTAVAVFIGTAVSLMLLYGLGGLVTRYTCDLRLSLLLVAGLFVINAYNNMEEGYAKTFAYKIFMLACVLSIFAGFALTFGGNYEMWNLVKTSSPDTYSNLFNLFV